MREIVRRADAGERFAVGLLAHKQGSAPQKPGARLIVLPDGTMRGTVGGGCLEMETRRRALIALHTGETDLFELRLDDDFGWDDGLICGGFATLLISPDPQTIAPAIRDALAARERGERCLLITQVREPSGKPTGQTVILPESGGEVPFLPFAVPPHKGPKPVLVERDAFLALVEPVRPDPILVVMGCGHIGNAVVELAASVGFSVVAVDDRADYASAERLPSAAKVVCDDMLTVARELPSGPDTFWVIVTRGHRNDGKVLAEVIRRSAGYIGMIGSRRKVRMIREGMEAEGIATAAEFSRVHAPIGLDIGAESPREIALSIVAQLVAVRHGKSPAREP